MRGLTALLRALIGRPRPPIIHLYCLCWNEERMLPFFFRHYDPLVARYFVFDNGSTDRSLDMLAAHPKVTVDSFRPPQDTLVDAARGFYETVWHRSRGVADWVFIVNIDEHLHHPDGSRYFQRCRRDGITAMVTTGYEMVAATFPRPTDVLSQTITRGARAEYLDKLCAFRPDAIERLQYSAGRHGANPEGRVVFPKRPALRLLHYKYLGSDYVIARYAELGARIGATDRERGWGRHYFQPSDALIDAHRQLLAGAQPVAGLPD